MPPTILMLDPDLDYCRSLEHYLSQTGAQLLFTGNVNKALAAVEQEPVDLIILELRLPEGSGLEFIRKIRRHERKASLPILVLTTQSKPDQIKDAYQAGADDFLVKTVDLSTVEAKIGVALQAARVKREEQSRKLGKVIAFFSPKGGSGCSTILAHLGGLLVSHYRHKIVLLDLNLDFPSLNLVLNIRTTKALTSLVMHDPDALSAEDLQQFLTRHRSGVELLPGTLEPVDAEQVNTKLVLTAIRRLQEVYDFILIDMPQRYSPLAMTLFSLVDQVCILFPANILGVGVTQQAYTTLLKAGVPEYLIVLLGNYPQAEKKIKENQLGDVFGRVLFGVVPYTKALGQLELAGELLTERYSGGPILQLLDKLATRLRRLPSPKSPQPLLVDASTPDIPLVG